MKEFESPINESEEIKDLTGIIPDRLFRIKFGRQRLYVRPTPFTYYSGLTGALDAARFKSDMGEKILKTWREQKIEQLGIDGLNEYVEATADFGTLVHMALVTIKEKGFINWAEERDKAESYFVRLFEKTGDVDTTLLNSMIYAYQKNVASLMQFVYERVQQILAIEVPVIWEDLRIATPIDLVCSCRQTEKGDFANTVINIKTSKSISEHHLEQVSCELTMWNQTYQVECENAAILRTKDWREGKVPTFEYKYLGLDQAMDYSADAFQRLTIALRKGAYLPNPIHKRFVGETKIGESPEILENSLEQEWAEYWKSRQ